MIDCASFFETMIDIFFMTEQSFLGRGEKREKRSIIEF